MKKVVLVLATALTLLSCEKETIVSNQNKTCDCYTESQNKYYNGTWTENSPYYNPNAQPSVSYGTSIIYDEEKDFCSNAYDWKDMGGYRKRRVCK